MLGRDDHVPPVGFAREPADERKRWVSRIVLAAFMVLLGWLLITKVISPPDTDGRTPAPVGSTSLPGPL